MNLDLKHPAYVLAFAAVISAVFTAGVVALQVATAERVERNELMRDYRALARVFAPVWADVEAAGMTDAEVLALVDARVEPTPREAFEGQEAAARFQAYATDAKEALAAVAVRVRGNGFWAPIKGFAALAPDLETMVALTFTEQKETPGLGGRIQEEAFERQFRASWRKAQGREPLDVSPPEEGERIIYVGRGEPAGPADPRHGRSVDAITGATQTSLAVERILNEHLRDLPRDAAGPAKE